MQDEREPPGELLANAEAGDAEAQNELGLRLIDLGRPAEAVEWFNQAAGQGLPKANHNLAVLCYRAGSMDLAKKCFERAIRDGWMNSMFAYGMICLSEGQADYGMELLDRAGRLGHADAQGELARIYVNHDTRADDVAARHWAELAAKQGNAVGIFQLGLIFHEGRGVPRNPPRAAAFFLDAAHRDHPGAQLMIGVAFHAGAGVPVDRIEAAHWVLRSAAQGNELAADYLRAEAGLRDIPTSELEEAQRRAALPLSALPPPPPFDAESRPPSGILARLWKGLTGARSSNGSKT